MHRSTSTILPRMTLLVLPVFLGLAFLSCVSDLSKPEAEAVIESWYQANSSGYTLEAKGNEAEAKISRYHPDRPDEKDDLIGVNYRGMYVEIMFRKPLAEIDRTPAAFQENFYYVVIDDIYTEISTPGWKVYPEVPVSSNDDPNCIKFTKVTADEIAFEVNWETYTVMGYSDDQKCQDELEIADAGVSEECYVSVRRTLPLKLVVEAKMK